MNHASVGSDQDGPEQDRGMDGASAGDSRNESEAQALDRRNLAENALAPVDALGKEAEQFATRFANAEQPFATAQPEWGADVVPLRYGKLLACLPAGASAHDFGMISMDAVAVRSTVSRDGQPLLTCLHAVIDPTSAVHHQFDVNSTFEIRGVSTLEEGGVVIKPEEFICANTSTQVSPPVMPKRGAYFDIMHLFVRTSEFANSKSIVPSKNATTPCPSIFNADGTINRDLAAREQFKLAGANLIRVLPYGALLGWETGNQLPPEGNLIAKTVCGAIGLGMDCVKWTWLLPKALAHGVSGVVQTGRAVTGL